MKIFYIVIVVLLFPLLLRAQSSLEEYKRERNAQLKAYKERVKTEFEIFREKRNREFAELIARRWNEIKHYKGIEPPVRPEPVKPILKDDNEVKIPPMELPIGDIVKIPAPVKRVPLNIVTPLPRNTLFSVSFYGQMLRVGFSEKTHKFKLANIREEEIGKRWRTMSDGRMEGVINDFLQNRERFKMNDYIYVLSVTSVCDAYFGKECRNESVLMQAFILTQTGYDVKVARKNSALVLLLNIAEKVYRTTYLTMGDKKYYVVNDRGEDGVYYTYNDDFSSKSQPCSMQILEPFKVAVGKLSVERLFVAERYPDLAVNIAVDEELMRLYDNYPILDWELYANAPMSVRVAEKLFPLLESKIQNRTEEEAVDIILNFVQTAFKYKTDDEQFGYERPFFVDELFYYEYSDCEDRAILFSYLVRELLNLKVALLYYPNHLATAVKFPRGIEGDYIDIKGERYIICDPTYINARIGEAMPHFKRVKAKVVML